MKSDDVNRMIEEMSEKHIHISDKKWVGLTPMEFNSIKDTATTVGYAITKTEAVLKEKNT